MLLIRNPIISAAKLFERSKFRVSCRKTDVTDSSCIGSVVKLGWSEIFLLFLLFCLLWLPCVNCIKMDERAVLTEDLHFSIADYAVFILLLVVSSLIGIYYGFIAKRKQDNTAEYLLGGKQLTLFPISISLVVSWEQFLLINLNAICEWWL